MTKQATDLDHIAEDIAQQRIALENAIAKSSTPSPEVPPVRPVPVPQAAWERLEQLQLAAQVSHQQLQVFVDGLALGQGMAQGAKLTQMPQGGWCWVAPPAA